MVKLIVPLEDCIRNLDSFRQLLASARLKSIRRIVNVISSGMRHFKESVKTECCRCGDKARAFQEFMSAVNDARIFS